ncbi:MAG: TlpA family protein disulfide reductase [Acidimicrobiales bacterium]
MSRPADGRAAPKSSRTQQQIRRERRRRFPKYRVAATVGTLAIAATVLGLHLSSSTSTPSSPNASRMGTARAVGLEAPTGTFTTTSGEHVSVASLRGEPTLLWFVATWCSSCQAGTQTMAQNVTRLRVDGVHVVEIELYRDLGQSGPSISTFGRQFAGVQFFNPDWTFATSSSTLTRNDDPYSYLDIYYLLSRQGRIVYVNGSPSSTMPNLLSQAAKLA